MPKIVAYLSHSYHPEDRAINMAIWRKLNALDVAFAVDPPSPDRPMDVTFLERMMQRSHCFVAIVPDRSRALESSQASPTWSPYQEFECRLADSREQTTVDRRGEGYRAGTLVRGTEHALVHAFAVGAGSDLDDEMRRFVDEATTREHEPSVMPKMGILRWTPADADGNA